MSQHRARATATAFSARSAVCCFLCAALGVLAPDVGLGQDTGQRAGAAVEQYARTLGLGAPQLRASARGQVVVRLLETDDDRDVAVVGMILVRAPVDAVVAQTLALQGSLLTGANRFGAFADPPAAADVRDVMFDRSEYKGLRGCRPGDCDFKLSAPAMASFIADVPWSSPNAKQQADNLLRDQLLRLVADYRQRGDAAMPTYDDGRSVRSADAFAALLAQASPSLTEHAPALLRYLTTYPSGRPVGTQELVYWSEERRPRMRPTLTVNHVVGYAPSHEAAFIARKQIYANHYFEAALELVAVLDDRMAAAPSSYLITVRRFRFDYLPRGILNVRGRVRNHLVETTRSDLARARAAIERARVAGQP